MRILGIAVLFFILLAATVAAGKGQTTLLATSDPFEGGVTAILTLETKPGTGKIFIESSPLTKVDTQISTRFAKEVACNYLGRNCDKLDFFYTIKARATIIGGPSAGAAMAALTVAVLEDAEFNDSVAITGTINSGNVIGPVGGVSEKIKAASEKGITKVLIPKGEQSSFSRNESVDVFNLGNELGVDVVDVFSLDEALLEFTGKTYAPEGRNIEIDERYSRVMEQLAVNLCERNDALEKRVDKRNYNASFDQVFEIAENLSGQGEIATQAGSNYAAASFCFGSNVRYKYLELTGSEVNDAAIAAGLNDVGKETNEFEASLKNATTVSDAQILAVVKDRIGETKGHINASREAQSIDESIFELAFAIERLESAHSWAKFLGQPEETQITEDMLREACLQKLGEAEEMVEYSDILILSAGDGARARMQEAQRFLDNENYIQCLHRATLSKAEASTLLSVVGVKEEAVREIVERKLDAAQASIARQERFPVVGYSYFEYASSLKDTDIFSALLFSEYALEFSNMEIYFREEQAEESMRIELTQLYFPVLIVIVGVLSFAAGAKYKPRPKRILINRRRR